MIESPGCFASLRSVQGAALLALLTQLSQRTLQREQSAASNSPHRKVWESHTGWLMKINAMLREAKQEIAALLEWLKEVKAELSKSKLPMLVELLSAYYNNRNKGAYNSKARITNLKKLSEAVSYLEYKHPHIANDLDTALHTMQNKIDTLKKYSTGKQIRIKELDELLRMVDYYEDGNSVADKLKTIRFEKSRQKYKAEHDEELRLFCMAEPKLKGKIKMANCPLHHGARKRSVWKRSTGIYVPIY